MNNGFIALIEEQKSKGKAFRADTEAEQRHQEFKFVFFFYDPFALLSSARGFYPDIARGWVHF